MARNTCLESLQTLGILSYLILIVLLSNDLKIVLLRGLLLWLRVGVGPRLCLFLWLASQLVTRRFVNHFEKDFLINIWDCLLGGLLEYLNMPQFLADHPGCRFARVAAHRWAELVRTPIGRANFGGITVRALFFQSCSINMENDVVALSQFCSSDVPCALGQQEFKF